MRIKILRKMKAKRESVPFKLSKFWPPYYSAMCNGEYREGLRLVYDDLYRAKRGDVVPVFEGGGKRHLYRFLYDNYKQGGDWGGVSNREFFLEYERTEEAA